MVRKVIGYIIVAMVVLAIWRGSGGNVEGIINAIWGIIEQGAEIVARVWDALVPIANDAVGGDSEPAPSSSP